jgi:hypothetical protein
VCCVCHKRQADLLVCDANDHVVCLPKFLGPVLPKLRTGGWVVLTLKFHGRGLKNDDLPARLAHLLPVSQALQRPVPSVAVLCDGQGMLMLTVESGSCCG